MKTARIRADRSSLFAGLAVVGALVLAPCLVGCSGGAEGGGGSNGSGGNSNDNGSGGSTSSGGSNGSGGKNGSGGMVGSGGTNGSGGSTSGSGGSSAGSGGSSGAPCDAPTMLFQDSAHGCLDGGGGVCHSSAQTPILTGDNIFANMKGKKSGILCLGSLYIDPSNPKNSVLYKVVDGTSCTLQMPQPPRTAPVTDAQKACLLDWISKSQ